MAKKQTVSLTRITAAIHVIRGHRVMLDADLAALFGVSTKRLNEQVTRNLDRFPEDFMFALSREEAANLKSQFATSSHKHDGHSHGGHRKLPRVFTEHGAVMLANVLRSKTAVDASIQVVRAFVQIRALAATYDELRKRLHALEEKYDGEFEAVFAALRELMEPPPPPPHRKLGFHVSEGEPEPGRRRFIVHDAARRLYGGPVRSMALASN